MFIENDCENKTKLKVTNKCLSFRLFSTFDFKQNRLEEIRIT
jgi:hypothetical protein